MHKPNDLNSYWMPFTANRAFKKHPKLLVSAKDMYYQTFDGRMILDATAGLWCCNAGHGRSRIVSAIREAAEGLDYSPGFQLGHSGAFEAANRLLDIAPKAFAHVFFTNSGSESVDTALKIARAYQQRRGETKRTRLIGRERGYHGVGYGGISVGGIAANRENFGPLLPDVDHLCHTHDLSRNAFTKGLPEYGVEFADDLTRLVKQYGAQTIAAVIVEPVAGSTGVLIPPKGYLQRLREICDEHDILLIFDEVITGFGRLGAPFAADFFGVVPDMITLAKGLTSGTVPMGAVLVSDKIHKVFMKGPDEGIELFHGYTYSGHPLACAAAIATLKTYEKEDLFAQVNDLAPYWEDALHSLQGHPHIVDIRNLGLMGAIELESRKKAPGARAMDVFNNCFEHNLLIRVTGETIALSPPFIISKKQIDKIIDRLGAVLKTLD
jgi:beta-alanine--pyruvate transaminase